MAQRDYAAVVNATPLHTAVSLGRGSCGFGEGADSLAHQVDDVVDRRLDDVTDVDGPWALAYSLGTPGGVGSVTVANVEMAKAWDGEEGDRWTEHSDRYDTASRRHLRRLLDTAAVAEADHILDIGCGTGKATRDAARQASRGGVLGVDLSARMLELARARSAAEGLTNVTYLQADAQVHAFDAERFDVAISNFGTMFFDDPVAAFANIGRAVRPGGRLVLLAWRDLGRNEWLTAIRGALAAGRTLPEPPPRVPSPFALADPEWVRSIVGAAGFEQILLEEIEEPIELGDDAEDAFGFVSTMGIVHGLTHDLEDSSRIAALDELRSVLTAHDTGGEVLLGSSAWLVSARRP